MIPEVASEAFRLNHCESLAKGWEYFLAPHHLVETSGIIARCGLFGPIRSRSARSSPTGSSHLVSVEERVKTQPRISGKS